MAGSLQWARCPLALMLLAGCSTPPSLYQPAHVEGKPETEYRVDLADCKAYERGTRLYAAMGAFAGGIPTGALGAAAAAGLGGGIAAGVGGVNLFETPAGIIADCMRRKGYQLDG